MVQNISKYLHRLHGSAKDIVTIYPGGVLDIVKFDNTLEGLYKCLATTASDFLEHEFRLTVAEPCNLCRYFEMFCTI
jgi:hypothetical protein